MLLLLDIIEVQLVILHIWNFFWIKWMVKINEKYLCRQKKERREYMLGNATS